MSKFTAAIGLLLFALIVSHKCMWKLSFEGGRRWPWVIVLCVSWLIGAYGSFLAIAWFAE